MKYHRPTTRRQHFALETLKKKKDGYMILERVESEHIETAEEIVYNFCFGWNIICLHKDGNMRFTEI